MPTTVATGMRRPRMHGTPPIWSARTVIRLKVIGPQLRQVGDAETETRGNVARCRFLSEQKARRPGMEPHQSHVWRGQPTVSFSTAPGRASGGLEVVAQRRSDHVRAGPSLLARALA